MSPPRVLSLQRMTMQCNHLYPLTLYVIQTGQYDFYTPALLVCPRTSNAYNSSSGLVSAGGSDRAEAVAKLWVQFCVDNLHDLELLINKQANPHRSESGRRTRARRLYWPVKPCQVLLVV